MFDVAEVKYFDPTPKIPPKKKQKKNRINRSILRGDFLSV